MSLVPFDGAGLRRFVVSVPVFASRVMHFA
jgi:hypothetical protein